MADSTKPIPDGRPLDRRFRPSGGGGAPGGARPGHGAAPALTPRPTRARSRIAQPRTMALMVMFVCFAVSGALRVLEMAQEMTTDDWDSLSGWTRPAAEEAAAPAIVTEAAAPAAGEGGARKATAQDAAVQEAAAGAEIVGKDGTVAVAPPEGVALAAMSEADRVALGMIQTASTPEAEDGEAGDEPGDEAGAPHAAAPAAPPPLRVAPGDSVEAAQLLEALRRREQELAAFAQRLKERDAALNEAAQTLEKRARELESAKEEFSALVATVDRAAERDVSHLVIMYEKMKPKEAAALFDAMDPSFASGFLSRMKPDRASAIMSKMDTEKAYQVSLFLAGRNVRRGKDPIPTRRKP